MYLVGFPFHGLKLDTSTRGGQNVDLISCSEMAIF